MAKEAPKPAPSPATVKTKADGPTSGVMAPGAAGKAAREAARAALTPKPTGWRDPNANYAEDDDSIDARMWRLSEGRTNA